MSDDFQLLRVDIAGGVATATIDNPPINLMRTRLLRELVRFADDAADNPDVRVVVLQSANPAFFIAHFDVETILTFPTDGADAPDEALNEFFYMCERFRTMPKATIAKIAGRVGGGGAELAAAMDMRFGAIGHTVVNQMEVALGIMPGGTGTQRIPELIGRSRTLELVLGCDDVDALTAERWGWLNRAMPLDELDDFVDRLATRIASFPPSAVAFAKQSILNAGSATIDGLREEAILFQKSVRTESAQRAMRRFLEIGGQTREGEQRIGELMTEI